MCVNKREAGVPNFRFTYSGAAAYFWQVGVVGDPGGSPRHKNFDSRKFADGRRREAGRGGKELSSQRFPNGQFTKSLLVITKKFK